MAKYKICVYAISKNEEQFVDRWMDAVSEADLVVVTDTGSTDGTVERLRQRGAIVFEEKISPWRFDVARNIALSHLPEDTDICVSNDLDEVFEKGWRQKLEESWCPRHTRARYWFVWSHHPEKRFGMEKIHLRKNYQWIRPVHEILEYKGEEEVVFIEDLVLHHYPDEGKPRSQYLPLLELSVAENPEDDRAMFWLGREYYYYGQYDNAIETLAKHLQLPNAAWPEERSASMRYTGLSYKYKKDYEQARSWFFRAAAECDTIREPWLEIARLGYLEKDWQLIFFAVEKALAISEKTGSYLIDPAAWGYELYDLGSIACYYLEMYDKGEAYGRKALRLKPGDERLQQNLQYFTGKRDGGRADG